MAEMKDMPPPLPAPPSEEEIKALADALGMSFEAARALAGAAAISGTELPNGQIIDA